ncbi:MAG: hypothetical protein NTW67_02665 [Candidatus Woesearchaeota archaeon]|nr:hypothetical protein [Candidatus Woesearchaeota archaeon]
MKKIFLLLILILLLCINIAVAAPVQITSNAVDHYWLHSAPGLNTIVYSTYLTGPPTWEDQVVKDVRGGGSATAIGTVDNSYPDINTNGDIVYVGGDGEIYKYVGSTETQLTSSGYSKYNPDTCPDNTYAVYWADNGSGYNHIYIE